LDDKIFERFVFANYIQTVVNAVDSTEREAEIILSSKLTKRPPKAILPGSLARIRELYDLYRKTGRLPKRIKDAAKRIKDQYLRKTQSAWRKYSYEYREGDVATQERVIQKIKDAANTAQARAKTIVRTETTNYYNQTRREIYDRSDAVTHYLFLAIRDQATTKWCTDRTVDGKRGRHGLVYRKDDPLTEKETPACHWNCRSEMVPLIPLNPRHKILIEDDKIQRRNNTCAPLPKGWV
jgi:SPP1 gp7 family putative phage head morphogenesis protein